MYVCIYTCVSGGKDLQILHAAMYITASSIITPIAPAVLVLSGTMGRHASKITTIAPRKAPLHMH
ncbi:hypothetical protein HanIR_Chr16g0825451 [Helianthus annuus]|nr:hypothetical protein HanIR_Chr16g0825451 [Helianthus annuus]